MGHGDSPRNICTLIKANGTDCNAPVPPGAPVSACLPHLQEAFLYINDLIEEHSPETVRWDPRKYPEPSTVYYLLFGDRIKIGATRNLRDRLRTVPHDELLATEPGGFDVEQERHHQFRAYRIFRNREWFRDCPELREHISALRCEHGDPADSAFRGQRSRHGANL